MDLYDCFSGEEETAGVPIPPAANSWWLADPVEEVYAEQSSSAPATRHAKSRRKTHGNERFREDFEVLRRVGGGTFGTVFLVRSNVDEMQYAVKRIRFFVDSEGHYSESVLREVQSFSRLNHPNIARYHTAWAEDGELARKKPKHHKKCHTDTSEEETAVHKPEFTLDDADDDPFGCDYSRAVLQTIDNYHVPQQHTGLTPEIIIGNGGTPEIFSDDIPIAHPKPVQTRHRFKPKMERFLYIQMQFYPDVLLKYLQRRTHVNIRESVEIFLQITLALRYIHKQRVIHRDLKPGNIFLTKNDTEYSFCSDFRCKNGSKVHITPSLNVFVGDFGLMTLPSQAELSVSRNEIVVRTKRQPSFGDNEMAFSLPNEMFRRRVPSGNVSPVGNEHTQGVGSVSYASPEQLSSTRYGQKTDIYSLGIILFELFTLPFSTEMERVSVLSNVKKGELPDDFEELYPGISEMVRRCVNKHPDLRPTADEILSDPLWAPYFESDESVHDSDQLVILSRTFYEELLSCYNKHYTPD